MPTFSDFLTPAGAIVAAGVVTSLIEILKASVPIVGDKISGALQAFFFTGVLYVLTASAVGATTPDAALNVFLAWLTCASAAIGLKSVATHVSDLQASHDYSPPSPAPAEPVPVTPPPDPAADPATDSEANTGDS